MKNIDLLKERVSEIHNLPTLPQVATRLLAAINNPASSSTEIAFLVGQDLSLSARILRLANSAFYGMPRTITTIQNSVVVLGYKVISTLALSLTVFDMFPEDRNMLFDRRMFWRHSLCSGVVARFCANNMHHFVLFDSEEAFCACLLHDVGKVVMEQYLHREFRKALAHAKEYGVSFVEAEQKVNGYTHTDVAQWLTGQWGLPAQLLLPIIHHHDPQNTPEHNDLVTLCHYADYLCHELGVALYADASTPGADLDQVAKLEIGADIKKKLADILPEEIKKADLFYDLTRG